jgi:predicted 3-demethylubiquinone-9 3-methyltransferase (glyoxalase superfamily)
MNNSIYPCLWFNGDAAEAAALYSAAFDDTEMKICTPLVVTFQIKGKPFMGLNGGPQFRPNPSISFFNTCTTTEELDRAWELLSDGGKVLMPLDRYPWSERYGWVEDRYGVSWQLTLGLAGSEKDDVFPALMFTGAQNGKAESAMRFYTSLFKDSSVDLVARYEAGEHDTEGNVKHAQFTLNGFKFGLMDSSGDHKFAFNEGVSLVVNCDTQEEIDFYWVNLSEGGREGRCGWCQDAFGVWWQVVPTILGTLMSDPEKAPKVMEAFMAMTKFDIEALKKAADNH